jgi:hypothetical protein
MLRVALRIADLVLGHEPRAERAEGLGAFPFGELADPIELKDALGDVIGETVAGDRLHRLVLGEIAGAAADDDAQLDLIVELGRALGDHGVVVRAADGARRLVEDQRLLGKRHAGFSGMVGVVEADGQEIADLADAGADARGAAHERQFVGLELAQLGEALGRERLAGNVGYKL